MTVPLPGWYPDPSGAADFRWWDGTTWTDAISDTADVAAPQDAHPVGGSEATDDPGSRDVGSTDVGAETAAADEVRSDGEPIASTSAGPGSPSAGSAQAARSRAGGGRLVTLLVAFSLVISGGVVGLIGWRNFQSARSADGSPGSRASVGSTPQKKSDPSSSSARDKRTDGRSGQLDEVTRKASLGRATMVLPAEPYELVSGPITIPDVFDAMFAANAPVHPDYNGSDTWAATVGIGHIPAESWTGDDLPGFGRKALKGISEQFFGYTPTSVQKLNYQPITVGSTSCAELTANVHYAVKGLASKFDRVRIVGCPDGTDGSVVAAVSSVPDDASTRVTALAERSLATFSVE